MLSAPSMMALDQLILASEEHDRSFMDLWIADFGVLSSPDVLIGKTLLWWLGAKSEPSPPQMGWWVYNSHNG